MKYYRMILYRKERLITRLDRVISIIMLVLVDRSKSNMADLKTWEFTGDAMSSPSTGGSEHLCYCSDMMLASCHHVAQCQC